MITQLQMNWDSIVPKAVQLVRETGQFIKSERQKWSLSDVKIKEDTSLVTSIDVASEQRLVEGLKKILPEADFMAEEAHSQRKTGGLTWIIDPVDGTTNLVHNFPVYCISVALAKEDKVVLGIIYEINTGDCFVAHEGAEGAFLNDEPMKVTKVEPLRKTLLATGFPTVNFDRLDYYLEVLGKLMKSTQGVRRLGSAAMDLAYVACGRCDGFFEYGLNAWDVAAGAYLVQKAGGKVTDFNGGDNFLFGREIVASNALIHEEFLKYF
jgi:myo-inositol-1(or 4)-monophosphatase